MSLKNEEYEYENPFGLEIDSDFHATRRNVTISLIKEYSKNKREIIILDAGCGKGDITKSIKQGIPAGTIDAIDISEKAIEIANNDGMGINFIQADALSFKGLGYSYDFIILNNIYEHIESPTGLLVNLKQLLANDGVIIISTPNRYHIKNVLRKFLGLRIVIPEYHITEYSIGQIYDHHFYADLQVKKVVIPEFRRERFRIIDFVIYKIIQPVLDSYLKLLKSDTRLGSLLFFVSGKIN